MESAAQARCETQIRWPADRKVVSTSDAGTLRRERQRRAAELGVVRCSWMVTNLANARDLDRRRCRDNQIRIPVKTGTVDRQVGIENIWPSFRARRLAENAAELDARAHS